MLSQYLRDFDKTNRFSREQIRNTEYRTYRGSRAGGIIDSSLLAASQCQAKFIPPGGPHQFPLALLQPKSLVSGRYTGPK